MCANSEERVVRSSCRGCHGVCQVLVHLDKEGKVVKVTGDPDSPTSKGHICPKGMAAPLQLYHPDRLLYPLRRKGPRGSGQWERITWEEALSEIAEKFDQIRRESGPEYVSLAQGTGRPYSEFAGRFIHAFGSPNHISPSHNCFLHRLVSSGITVGYFPQPDIYGHGGTMSECILQVGENIADFGGADGYCGSMVRRANRAAKHLIVVDPRKTACAKEAEYHLQLRPGTDCALTLAMLHVIIGEGLYDKHFVENYCVGFEELKAHVVPYTPEWAEPITRVPAEQIRAAARTFANAASACVNWGNGLDQSVNAFQAGRAYLILMAITGNLDVPGGNVQWVPPAGLRNKSPQTSKELVGNQFLSQEQKDRMIGAGKFPFVSGCHQPTYWHACISGDPYRPRALWLVGCNPLVTQTRGDLIEQGLREMEFVVVSDLLMTPTAELADIVLPAAHWLEQRDISYYHKIWCALARPKLAQMGEVRDDRDVFIDLAHRLGMDFAFPWKDWDAYVDWILEPSGMTFDEFVEKGIVVGDMKYRKYEQEGFKTPSGKVELVSSIMERAGQPGLPIYVEPPLSHVSTPELAKEYPLILMSGAKVLPFFHSAGRNIEFLRNMHPKPMVDVHPVMAEKLGLKQDDPVMVKTPYGEAKFYVHIDDRLMEDLVHVEHAWWFPERPGPDHGWKESCANMLYGHDHFDPQTGAEPLRGNLCKIEPFVEA